jgi:single-strand DNA-binding protein
MSDLNKVMLIGRLTRDPEVKEFANGGKVANMGLVVHNRRKNQQSGEWEETPVWVNLKAFNHEPGRKTADLAEKHLHRGQQAYFEGHLVLEEWADKEDGKPHSKTVVYVDDIKFIGGGKPAEPGAPGAQAAGEAHADGGESAAAEQLPKPAAKRGRPKASAAAHAAEAAGA